MSKRPFLSIVVPSYNQGRFLDKCLVSIESQGFKDWEVLIMDGGSKDDSVAIIRAFARRNPGKVLWRSHKDAGQLAAINEGMSRAKGRVVAYLNSDDAYLSGAFRKVKEAFAKKSTQWVVGECLVSNPRLSWTFFYKKIWPFEYLPWLVYLLNPINQPSVFLRRSFVGKVGVFDGNFALAFDYEYWIRCMKISSPRRLRQPLACFRVHKEAKGSKQYRKQFDEEIMALRKHHASWVWIGLHRLHNLAIVSVYRLLK